MSGSARTRPATSRRPGATPADGSSTATTPAGAPAATSRSSSGCIDFGRGPPADQASAATRTWLAPGLSREKVLATVVRLLEATLIRVGNDEYARLNRSFGLTTLRGRHVRVEGTSIRFRFRGKSGQRHEVGLRDRRLAAIVRRCQELPGQELFAYVGPDGEVHDVASDDVNDYLREISGADVTAKDFRTWAGTVLAYRALRAAGVAEDARDAQRNVVAAVKQTALQLGNTPAVARRSYVHPAVVDAYLDGSFRGALLEAAEARVSPPTAADRAEELEVIALLRRHLRLATLAPTATQTLGRVTGDATGVSRRAGRRWDHPRKHEAEARTMCMNCGCGEDDKRHHPTDITREDLQRAADGSGMTLRDTAENVQRSTSKLADGQADGRPGRRATAGVR